MQPCWLLWPAISGMASDCSVKASSAMGIVGRCLRGCGGVLLVIPLLVGIIARSADTVFLDATLAKAGISWEIELGLSMDVLFLVCFIVAAWNRPLGTGAVVALIFAVLKHWADFSQPAPQLSCGSGGPCVVLVTGANSGIGFATSQTLASQGHTVLMGCRSAGRCTAAKAQMSGDPDKIIPVPGLDLTSLAHVHDWVDALKRIQQEIHLGKVDVFLQNAGVMPEGNTTTAQGLEMGLGVMHVAHVALTKWMMREGLFSEGVSIVAVSSVAMVFGAFHESLLASPSGEGDLRGEVTVGVNVPGPLHVPPLKQQGMLGSGFATRGYNWGSYARSKLANVYWASELARRCGVAVTSVHPGMVHTPMAASVGGSKMQEKWRSVFLRSAEKAGEVIIMAASKDHPKGAFLNGMAQPLPTSSLPAAAANGATAARLWEVTERLIGEWEQQHLGGQLSTLQAVCNELPLAA